MGYLEFVLSLCKQTLAFVDFLSFVLCFVLHFFCKSNHFLRNQEEIIIFFDFFFVGREGVAGWGV